MDNTKIQFLRFKIEYLKWTILFILGGFTCLGICYILGYIIEKGTFKFLEFLGPILLILSAGGFILGLIPFVSLILIPTINICITFISELLQDILKILAKYLMEIIPK